MYKKRKRRPRVNYFPFILPQDLIDELIDDGGPGIGQLMEVELPSTPPLITNNNLDSERILLENSIAERQRNIANAREAIRIKQQLAREQLQQRQDEYERQRRIIEQQESERFYALSAPPAQLAIEPPRQGGFIDFIQEQARRFLTWFNEPPLPQIADIDEYPAPQPQIEEVEFDAPALPVPYIVEEPDDQSKKRKKNQNVLSRYRSSRTRAPLFKHFKIY